MTKTGVPSKSSRWQHAMPMPDGDPTSRQRRRCLSSKKSTCTHTHVLDVYIDRCAKGTDEDGWGGPIAPINGLIMAATQDGTPCWEEIHPMKEFGKYGNTQPGNWNRVRSMEMNPPHRRCCPRWEKFRVRSCGFRAVFVCLC